MSYARTAVTRMTLDISRPDLQRSETVTLGDTNRRWEVTLINGGAPFRLPPNWTAALTGIKPDGTGLLNGCSVADGKIVYDFAAGAEIATCVGSYPVQFDIWDEVGELVASPKVYVNVLADVRPHAELESNGQYTQIGDLIGRVNQTDEDVDLLAKNVLAQGTDITALKDKITTAGTVTIPASEWTDSLPKLAVPEQPVIAKGTVALLMPGNTASQIAARKAKLTVQSEPYRNGQIVVQREDGEAPTDNITLDYIIIKVDNPEAPPKAAMIGVDAYGEGGGANGVDESAVKKIINSMLGNVENVRQYSASNPPPYPVTYVNGRKGAVTLTAQDVDADPSNTAKTLVDNLAKEITKDLANYYTKSQTLSKTEINDLVSTIPKFDIEVVSYLPTANISETTVYLVKSGAESSNLYTEYIRVNGAWERLGTQTVDLTGYATEAWVNTLLAAYVKSADMEAYVAGLLNSYLTTEEAETTYATKDELESVSLLPYGHSASWLTENGDPAQLYQIDGYVWGYVSGGGWTKSEIQYLVVSAEGDMVNAGGTPYLLRKGDEGTVYAYTEANADASIREVDELPESAEGVQDGDLVGYKGGKYQADVTAQSVPDYTNLAKTVIVGKRLSSSGEPTDQEGAAYVEEYIPFFELHTSETPTTVRIRGLGGLGAYNIIGASALGNKASASGKANSKPGIFSYSYNAASDTVTLVTVDSTDGNYWKYLRVVGVPSDGIENVIVTVNEPIENKTVTTVTWNRIGDYAPVFAGWSATEETYPVMDQKDESARHGDEAVYAVDGYLYTYLVNAGWARGGRYDSLRIDSQLSKTSKNAIQNRVVAGELESIKLRADSTDKKIAEVDGKVAAMAGGGGVADIPAVWKEAVEACIASVKSHQEGRHCVTFPFFSDNHQRNGFAGILIAHVMGECGIPYCFFGGDAITNGRASSAVKDGTATVEQEMIAQDKAFDNAMAYIPRGRFCRAVGNHDGYLLPYKDSVTGTVYGETVRYDRNRVYELFLRAEGVEQNKHFGGDGTYYYVEDLPSKVRFIVLNTNPATLVGAGAEGIEAAQLAWLRDTALRIGEDGWSVVIFSHCPISNHYHANVSNAAEVIAAVNAYTSADGSDGKPAVVGWFSGHIHRDRIYTGMAVNSTDDSEGTPLGFTQVTITSDANLDYDWLPSGGQPTTRPDLTRDMNGDTSHAIDFVTVNTERGEVYITRLGMGTDREYNYKEEAK